MPLELLDHLELVETPRRREGRHAPVLVRHLCLPYAGFFSPPSRLRAWDTPYQQMRAPPLEWAKTITAKSEAARPCLTKCPSRTGATLSTLVIRRWINPPFVSAPPCQLCPLRHCRRPKVFIQLRSNTFLNTCAVCFGRNSSRPHTRGK